MEKHVARPPFPIHGRIPNFKGAEDAVKNLTKTEIYRRAKRILVAPDSPLKSLRLRVMLDGKTLIMATPRLKRGYAVVNHPSERPSGTIRWIMANATFQSIPGPLDLVVQGCVAVDKHGWRLGKGGGYGDREISLARRLNPNVKVAVICHSLQVVERLPREEWDQKIDVICTEKRCFKTVRNI